MTEEKYESLLGELEMMYRSHMMVRKDLPLVFSLWNLHTFMFQEFTATPYLWVHSPVRGCGKTTLCRLLHLLSANGQFTVQHLKGGPISAR